MKQRLESLYFVAITFPEEIEREIIQLKHECATRFDSNHALRSPPHITLHMPFKWKDSKKEILINSLKKVASLHASVMVTLEDFGCFAPRVIYAHVHPTDSLEQLHDSVANRMMSDLNLFNANYKDKAYHPHVTIAFRDLKKAMFKEAWAEFKSRKIRCQFESKDFALLKHDGKIWHIDQFFNFDYS